MKLILSKISIFHAELVFICTRARCRSAAMVLWNERDHLHNFISPSGTFHFIRTASLCICWFISYAHANSMGLVWIYFDILLITVDVSHLIDAHKKLYYGQGEYSNFLMHSTYFAVFFMFCLFAAWKFRENCMWLCLFLQKILIASTNFLLPILINLPYRPDISNFILYKKCGKTCSKSFHGAPR